MSLDWPIRSVVSNAEFWKAYFWLPDCSPTGNGFEELVNHEEPVSEEHAALLRQYKVNQTKWPYCRLDLPVGEYCLRLQFDPQISSIYLYLCDRFGKEIVLGWDDQAHWHPHVLRWEELALFCRCIASKDPSLPHPGVALLLFCRFAPVTDSEDSGRALALLREAWRTLGLFREEQIHAFLKMVDFRGTGVEWRRDSQLHWTLHLDRDLHPKIGLYTLRCEENPDFPFEQLAAALSEAAQAICTQ